MQRLLFCKCACVVLIATITVAVVDVSTGSVTSALFGRRLPHYHSSLGLQGTEVLLQQKTEVLDMTTSRSWFSRMGDAIIGVFVGIVLLILSIGLTFATEQFAVKLELILGRAQRACVSNAPSASINANLDCRMVHMQGDMTIQKAKDAQDGDFGHAPNERAVVLKRTVESLQWKENVEKTNDTTTYTYTLEWVEEDIDSSSFKQSAMYTNPKRPAAYVSKTFYSTTNLGAYTLSKDQLDKLKRWHPSVIDEDSLKYVAGPLKNPSQDGLRFSGLKQMTRKTRVEGQVEDKGEEYWTSLSDDFQDLPRVFWYLERSGEAKGPQPSSGYGSTSSAGSVGDIRISYDLIRPGPVSVIGVIQDSTFREFTEHDAHNVDGRLTKDPIEIKRALEAEQDSCFDPLLAVLFDSKHARTVLLVEERRATKEHLFDDEHKKFASRLTLLRAATYFFFALSIFLIFYPVAEVFSFLPLIGEHIKNLIAFVLAMLSLLAGLILWLFFAGIAWAANRPWIITLALFLAASLFYLAGGLADGVWVDPPTPVHYSNTLVGEALYAVTLLPLAFVVYSAVEEIRYGINISRLNAEAGILDQ